MRILVLALRGLSPAFLGCYGNDWIDTPNLDRLAAEGVVFDNHFADCPEPVAARAVWRWGRHPFSLTAAAPSSDLLQLLAARKAATCLVSDGQDEFTKGWKQVIKVQPRDLEAALNAIGDGLDFLEDAEHWLLWVDLSILLPPWEVTEEFWRPYFEPTVSDDDDDEESEPLEPLFEPAIGCLAADDDETAMRLQFTFGGVVSMVDAAIGILQGELETRGLSEEVLWLVTSDHGLPLGEHGVVGLHRPWLHEELVHLPLLLRLPGRAEAGRRIAGLTQPCDLLPTLLDLFGTTGSAGHGVTLIPLVRGESEQVRSYVCSALEANGGREWALRTAEWTLLAPQVTPDGDPPRERQLYVRPEDRWEVNNLQQHHLELADQLEATLRAYIEAARQPGPLTPPELPGESESEGGDPS